jgi:hypothetical protein
MTYTLDKPPNFNIQRAYDHFWSTSHNSRDTNVTGITPTAHNALYPACIQLDTYVHAYDTKSD